MNQQYNPKVHIAQLEQKVGQLTMENDALRQMIQVKEGNVRYLQDKVNELTPKPDGSEPKKTNKEGK